MLDKSFLVETKIVQFNGPGITVYLRQKQQESTVLKIKLCKKGGKGGTADKKKRKKYDSRGRESQKSYTSSGGKREKTVKEIVKEISWIAAGWGKIPRR